MTLDAHRDPVPLLFEQIAGHRHHAPIAQGAQHTALTDVDIYQHPTSSAPEVNFATPRLESSAISAESVSVAMAHLRAHGRTARVHLIEGLHPPALTGILREAGLSLDREIALLSYRTQTLDSAPVKPIPKVTLPDGIRLELAIDHSGMLLRRHLWRSAHYDVFASSDDLDEAVVSTDLALVQAGAQLDILLWQHHFLVGTIRVTLVAATATAQISPPILMYDLRTPLFYALLYTTAARTALARKASLLFTTGESRLERDTLRAIGFRDSGSLAWYAEGIPDDNPNKEGSADDDLVGTVVTIR